MKWAAVIVAVAALMAPAVAHGTVARSATSGRLAPQPWQGWIDRSLIPIPNWPLQIRFAQCDGPTDGCFDGVDTIWVAPTVRTDHRRYVFLHELGHWFDANALNDHDRTVFMRIARSSGTAWTGDVEEVFADAFASCARWRTLADDHTGDSTLFTPGPRTYTHVCAWMRVVAGRYSGSTKNLGV